MDNTQPASTQNQMATEAKPQVNSKDNNLLVAIIISVLLTAMVVGSAVYLWQRSVNEKAKNNLKQKISSLEEQVSKVDKIETTPLPNSSPELTPTPATNPTANWKTYTDTETSATFSYPQDWTVSKQGSKTDPWIAIDSPHRGGPRAQAPVIGMSIALHLLERSQPILQNDLQQIERDEGVLKHYKVQAIKENFVTVSGYPAFSYEYEGSYHHWGINVAKDKTIVRLLITDFKVDPSLNTQEIANQILSTFKFTN